MQFQTGSAGGLLRMAACVAAGVSREISADSAGDVLEADGEQPPAASSERKRKPSQCDVSMGLPAILRPARPPPPNLSAEGTAGLVCKR